MVADFNPKRSENFSGVLRELQGRVPRTPGKNTENLSEEFCDIQWRVARNSDMRSEDST